MSSLAGSWLDPGLDAEGDYNDGLLSVAQATKLKQKKCNN